MQQQTSISLPEPDADSAAHSAQVAAFIRDRIRDAGGEISFAEYMHHCLYAPGLGYYAAGASKFGPSGDFVTAPEVSSLFGAIVAQQSAEVLASIGTPAILELGAGTGKLAVDVLRELSAHEGTQNCSYRILEVSADLRERQQQRIANEIPELAGQVEWIDEPPADFSGVVLANEVADALPVERFVRRSDGVRQLCVTVSGDAFELTERDAPEVLLDAVTGMEELLGAPLPDDYRSEVCLAAPGWIGDVAKSLANATVFLFDYGVGRREYYAQERSGGWLRCHFRHHAHDDPLILPGIQDLTAWVDFTAIADAAVENGLEIAGYLAQAQFLMGGGLDRQLARFADLPTDAQLKLSAEIKLLTLPSEMGEHFKCLAMSRGTVATPGVFDFADRTASLG